MIPPVIRSADAGAASAFYAGRVSHALPVPGPSAPGRRTRRATGPAVLRATVVSLVCLALGFLCFVVEFGLEHDLYGGAIPGPIEARLIVSLLLGAVVNAAAGPLRHAGLWNLLLVAPIGGSLAATPAGLVALVRLGKLRRIGVDVAALVVVFVCTVLSVLAFSTPLEKDPVPLPWTVLFGVVLCAAALLWGRVRGTREALVDSLRRQVDDTERARAATERENEALAREHRALVRQAETEQRAAIARDMHDSLAHHLSLVALHAGALAYRTDMAPERMREVAALIGDDARAANAELRQVLSALRDDDAEPLPTAAAIGAMVERERSEGVDVELLWDGVDPETLGRAGSATVVALARITRELLTNARKHASGAPVRLEVSRVGDDVVLLAANPVPEEPPLRDLGAGMGLVGVAERTRLLGGTLTVNGPRATGDREFRAEVRLPWTA